MNRLNVLIIKFLAQIIFLILMNNGHLQANSIIKESIDSLILNSDLIIHGSVLKIEPSRCYNASEFYRAGIRVIDNIKGKTAAEMLWIEGCGKKGDSPLVLANLSTGDESIFFLVKKLHNYEVLGACQGVFELFDEKITDIDLTVKDFKNLIQEFLNGGREKLKMVLDNMGKIHPNKQRTGGVIKCDGYELNGHRWGNSSLPQTIYINPMGALDKNNSLISFVAIKSAIINSFQHWENAPYTFHPYHIYPDPVNDIRNHLDNKCVISWDPLPTNIAAITYTTGGSNYTCKVDVVFNSNQRWAINDTTGIESSLDIENVGTHEIGHFWGLADLYESCQLELTMYGYITFGERKKITLEPGDEEGAMVTNPEFSGIISKDLTIPTSQNPSAQVRFEETTIASGASITLGSFIQVEVRDNITIEEGGKLDLSWNVCRFWPAKSLYVYGTLTTFEASFTNDGHSGSGWGGIGFHGKDASSSVIEETDIYYVLTYGGAAIRITDSSPTIKRSHIFMNPMYGTTGIYIGNNSSPMILDNVIENNDGNGIYISNSTGFIARNHIQNNNGAGIKCNFGGSPVLGEPGYYPGTNNEIKNNQYGVYASAFSSPYIGSLNNSWFRNNSIHSNIEYNLHVSLYSSVLAEYTWWGMPNPESTINHDGTSTVSYNPCLASSPENMSGLEQTSAQNTRYDLLIEAIDARYKGQIERSFRICEQIISNWPNSIEANQAIVELYCLFKTNKYAEIFAYCQSLNPENEILDILIQLHLMKMFTLENDLENALGIADKIIQKYPKTVYEKEALIEKFYIYFDKYLDYSAAQNILFELKAKYPDDIDATVIEALFTSENIRLSTAVKNDYPNMENKSLQPADFVLYQNYPNPFNPTTTIEFSISKSEYVTLTIYDILGEEVATLVSDRLSAGSYQYEWSRTRRIASGVYLYRLQAGEYLETRKMVLMK